MNFLDFFLIERNIFSVFNYGLADISYMILTFNFFLFEVFKLLKCLFDFGYMNILFIFSFFSLKLLNLCSKVQDVTVQFWNDIIEICNFFLELRNFRTIFICLLGSFLPGFSNFSLLRFKFLLFFFFLFFSLIEIFLEFLKFLFINILIMIDDLKILMIGAFK